MSFYLVTGGAGFIGSHLVEALVADGHTVRVLDDFGTGSQANLIGVLDRVEIVEGDVTDLAVVRRAVQGVEVVFHQAALAPASSGADDTLAAHEVCATGTLSVLIAAREAQVRRVVYAASASAYGDAGLLPRRETDPPRPSTPHAVAKMAGEDYCAAFTRTFGLETVRLRYFNVFGPRQTPEGLCRAWVAYTVEAVLAGRSPVICGDGRLAHDFTYVDDVVQANLLAAREARAAGKVYNVASGQRTTPLDLVARINDLLGTQAEPVHRAARPGEALCGLADISRAETDLGFCPSVDLKDGLLRCLDYYAPALRRVSPGPVAPTFLSLRGAASGRAVPRGPEPPGTPLFQLES